MRTDNTARMADSGGHLPFCEQQQPCQTWRAVTSGDTPVPRLDFRPAGGHPAGTPSVGPKWRHGLSEGQAAAYDTGPPPSWKVLPRFSAALSVRSKPVVNITLQTC